jgi:ribosomal protein S18 acetylase RimI-like enzyme
MRKIRIRKMTSDDFAYAIKLTDTMQWDLTKEDFEFMTALEPEGCFVAVDGYAKVGTITAALFGKVGWIGNVIVEASRRSEGIGALLVEHAVDYLARKSATTIGLYAYVNTVPFYEKLGFKRDSDFVRFAGQGSVQSVDAASVKTMTKRDLADVLDLDELCMGWNRERLLKRVLVDSNDLCYVAREHDELLGFIMGDEYRQEIGPCIVRSKNAGVAVNLFKTVLGKMSGVEVRLGIPKDQRGIIRTLGKMNFEEEFRVIRMYWGEAIEDTGCFYAMESLERG